MRMIVVLLHKIIFFLFPSLCSSCRIFLHERAIFCHDCTLRIFPIVSKTIDITSQHSVTVFAVANYTDPLKKLILSKSWSDYVSSKQLGELVWEMIPAVSQLDYDIIVPIPLHWTRSMWRGFNQAEEIACVIQKKKNVPLVRILKRMKRTVFQFSLASSMRELNVKNAFGLCVKNKELYEDKHILLVDDLMTTGSTIRAAAKELLALKPRKITVVVVCRVV